MIGLDWGTTSLRAYRLDQAGAVLDKRPAAFLMNCAKSPRIGWKLAKSWW